MKELSIEEKAKAYDKAREKIAVRFGTNVAEEIFSEFEESEDEKIRKELLENLRELLEMYNTLQTTKEYGKVQSWITWLEKQCEKETDPREENLEELLAADDIYQMAMNDDMVQEAKTKAINALSELQIGKLLELEKQCEQKSIDDLTQQEAMDIAVAKCFEQGEQKPSIRERYDRIKNSEWFKKTHEGMSISDDEKVDDVNYCADCINKKGCINCVDGDMKETEHKVKPKFHEGEWIVDNQGLTHQIERVVENVTTHTFGYDIVGGGYFNDNTEGVHLWTIQDTKDGDVLVETERDVILMFRGIGNTEWDDVIDYHCYYDCYRKDFIVQEDVNYWGNTENNQLKPATKEQRDLLFSKMKESGYEWDTEKKELKLLITNGGDFSETKNCGQKPVEWKQENREELTEFENAMMHIGGSFFGENAGLDPNDTATIKEQAKLLLELALKTEWSEEDENILQWIVTDIKQLKNYNKKSDAIVNKEFALLESIKQRYTWKPSSEQLYILNWLATNVLGDGVVDKKASEILYTLYDDLKKL